MKVYSRAPCCPVAAASRPALLGGHVLALSSAPSAGQAAPSAVHSSQVDFC
ncbi:hypothetical protein A2U01_0100811 [Trifolium medium]|uniref:Uncharacterized protein n=1 Tax=Trifolium medium TaxID=97028 RepID=A0A392UZI4_9FABA|nr:hypothetical protein [Trifolium medium]